MLVTLASYAAIIAAVTFGLANMVGGFVAVAIGMVVSRARRLGGGAPPMPDEALRSLTASTATGTFATWVGMTWLWELAEGRPFPVALFAFGLAWSVFSARDPNLNWAARHAVRGEWCGIVLAAIVHGFLEGGVRWY